MKNNSSELYGQPDFVRPRYRFLREQLATNIIALGTRIVPKELDPTLPFLKVWIDLSPTVTGANWYVRARVLFKLRGQIIPDMEFPLESADPALVHPTSSVAYVSAFVKGTGSPSEDMLLSQVMLPGAAGVGNPAGLVAKKICVVADQMVIQVKEISNCTACILPIVEQSNIPW